MHNYFVTLYHPTRNPTSLRVDAADEAEAIALAYFARGGSDRPYLRYGRGGTWYINGQPATAVRSTL